MVYRGAVGVGSAGPLDAGVAAGVVGQLAVLDVGTVVVQLTLKDRDTNTSWSELHPRRADAGLPVGSGDQTLGCVADTAASDKHKPELGRATDTEPGLVLVVSGGTHAVLHVVEDEPTAGGTRRYWIALDSCVSLISCDTDTDHGSYR